MIIRIHNTGDPYKLPTFSAHTVLPSFSLSFYHLLVFSDAKDRLSRQLLPDSVSFSLLLFNPKKVYIPPSISLYPFVTSCCGAYPTVRCFRTMTFFYT